MGFQLWQRATLDWNRSSAKLRSSRFLSLSLANTGMVFHSPAIARTTRSGWPNTCPGFGFSMSMSGLRSPIAWCAASLEKLARRFLPMMFGSQPYAASILCLSSAATATSMRFLVSQESLGDRTFSRPTRNCLILLRLLLHLRRMRTLVRNVAPYRAAPSFSRSSEAAAILQRYRARLDAAGISKLAWLCKICDCIVYFAYVDSP